jgi:DNA-binding NarL/FixJ family response regulator
MMDRTPTATVWLVEDNHLFRQGLAKLIDGSDDLACPMAVSTCEEALDALDAGSPPDIVLMDIGLPGMSGIDGTREIKRRSPATRVIMLTVQEEDASVFRAICAGASGYLLKPTAAERIVEAIRNVRKGAAPINGYIARKILEMFSRFTPPPTEQSYGLTKREKQILALLVDGLTMKQIAQELTVSYHTIDTHLRNIYEKLHVHSRSAAVAKVLQEGVIL